MANYDFSALYENNTRVFEVPIVLEGEVVHGFKRGSKELGIPTANLNMEQLGEIGDSLQTGIYYGWCLLREIPYCAVVSVGWNPFYKNEKKTIEAHLIASLDDFYGEHVSLLLFGYLRDEADFKSLDELIACINMDISLSKRYLLEDSSISKYSHIENWSKILSLTK